MRPLGINFWNAPCFKSITRENSDPPNGTEAEYFVLMRKDEMISVISVTGLCRNPLNPVTVKWDCIFIKVENYRISPFFLVSETPKGVIIMSSLCISLHASGSNQQMCNKAIINANLAYSTFGRAYDVRRQSKSEHCRAFRLFSYCSIVLNPETNQIWRANDCLLRDFIYLPQKNITHSDFSSHSHFYSFVHVLSTTSY